MAEQGRLKIALDRFISARLPQVDYLANYPGTIVAQNGQMFDFTPDSTKLPSIQGIGIYVGIPGVTFTLDLSASPRAVLFFAGGSPEGAALSMVGLPGLATLSIGSNGPAVARVGDTVAVTLSDIMQFIFTAPAGGGACVVTGPPKIPSPTTAIATGSAITTIA